MTRDKTLSSMINAANPNQGLKVIPSFVCPGFIPRILRSLHLLPITFGVLYVASPPALSAQRMAHLYAAATISRGYVVGSKLKPSGLHTWAGDTTWQLIGRKHPRVSGIAFAPGGKTIFLACGNGVMKSSDAGQSWKLTTDWRITEAQAIAISPDDPRRLFLATAFGLWRSTDSGESWRQSDAGIQKKFFSTIKPDRGTSGRLLAAGEGGIFFSKDFGHSWQPASLQTTAVNTLHQSRSQPEIWLAGTEQHGVFISTDNGVTWMNAQGMQAQNSIYSVSIAAHDPALMAAAGWDTGVVISRDGGRSWQQIGASLPTRHFYQIAFDPTHTNRIWAATVEEGIYFSDDFGKSWQYSGLYGAIVFDLYFHSGGN